MREWIKRQLVRLAFWRKPKPEPKAEPTAQPSDAQPEAEQTETPKPTMREALAVSPLGVALMVTAPPEFRNLFDDLEPKTVFAWLESADTLLANARAAYEEQARIERGEREFAGLLSALREFRQQHPPTPASHSRIGLLDAPAYLPAPTGGNGRRGY